MGALVRFDFGKIPTVCRHFRKEKKMNKLDKCDYWPGLSFLRIMRQK